MLIQELTQTEPKNHGIFSRAEEYLRLFRENKDGIYTEYCPWRNNYILNALKATADEPDDLIRGGKAAMHILSNVPVAIEPQGVFVTYGLTVFQKKSFKTRKGAPRNTGIFVYGCRDSHCTLLSWGLRCKTRSSTG